MRPEIRKTVYHVVYADRRQATLDGDELEKAIRAGTITGEDWVALADGIQRRYWDFPRFAAFSPWRYAPGPSQANLPPQASTSADPVAPPVRSVAPRSHVSATPVAPSTVAAVAAAVERDLVIEAIPLSAEERRVEEVMSRLGEVRQRMMSRPPSGAVPPVAAPASFQRPPSTSSHSAAVPNARTSAAVRPVAGPARGAGASASSLTAAAVAELDKNSPLYERKYASLGVAANVTDALDVPDSLEDALREVEGNTRKSATLVTIPKASERSKAVLAVLLMAIAAFLIMRLLNQ